MSQATVDCGFSGQIEIAMSEDKDTVYSQIRDQVDAKSLVESSFKNPEQHTTDDGNYQLYWIGMGYWDEGSFRKDAPPAEGTYSDDIVHDHTSGDPAPARMYFESSWTAVFNGDEVTMKTTVDGYGRISFSIPHDGLWAKKEDCLS